MKKLLLILSLLFGSLSLYSQNTSIKVNNLEIGQVYTDTQIRSSLGTPTSIRIPSPDDDVQGITVYMYNNNSFSFMEGEFVGFGLRDTTFTVNGFLKVSDDVVKANQMGGIITITECPDITRWAPNDNYRNNFGYLAIYFNTTTQKITLLVAVSFRSLL